MWLDIFSCANVAVSSKLSCIIYRQEQCFEDLYCLYFMGGFDVRLIHNMVSIDLNNGEYLVINTINGLIDHIDSFSYDVICKWKKLDLIQPEGKRELVLFNNLLDRGYLVNEFKEEQEKKKAVIETLRNKYVALKKIYNHLTFVITYNCLNPWHN